MTKQDQSNLALGKLLAQAFADTFNGGGWADPPVWDDYDDEQKARWQGAAEQMAQALRQGSAGDQGGWLPPGPPYCFDRYVRRVKMAEGVRINLARSLDEAIKGAVQMCPDPGTVLVLRPPTEGDLAAYKRSGLTTAASQGGSE